MKKLVVLLTLVASVSAFAQGTIYFGNKTAAAGTAPAVDFRVTYGTGGPATAGAFPNSALAGAFQGSTAMLALYGGPLGTAESALVLLTPAVGFRNTTATAGYVVGSSREIAGTSPGGQAVVQLRAWDTGVAGSTWEGLSGSYYAGVSRVITVGPLGGGSPPATPPNLVNVLDNTPIGTGTLVMNYVPEPSIIGLGLLGAVAGLMVFRRRN